MGYGAGLMSTRERDFERFTKRQGSRLTYERPEPIHQHMVRLAGIEPTTLGFGGQYSIH